jgi:hypothetical protein
MKDMAMVVAPIAVVVYFVCFPGQLSHLLDWVVMLARHVQ